MSELEDFLQAKNEAEEPKAFMDKALDFAVETRDKATGDAKDASLADVLGFDPEAPPQDPVRSPLANGPRESDLKLERSVEALGQAFKDKVTPELPDTQQVLRDSSLPWTDTIADALQGDSIKDAAFKNLSEAGEDLKDVAKSPFTSYVRAINSVATWATEDSAFAAPVEAGRAFGLSSMIDPLDANFATSIKNLEDEEQKDGRSLNLLKTLWEDTTGERWLTNKELKKLQVKDPAKYSKAIIGQSNFADATLMGAGDMLQGLWQLGGEASKNTLKGEAPLSALTLKAMGTGILDDATMQVSDPARRIREDPFGVMLSAAGVVGTAGRIGKFGQLAKTAGLKTAVKKSLPVPFVRNEGKLAAAAATDELYEGLLSAIRGTTTGRSLVDVAPSSPRVAVETEVAARQKIAGTSEAVSDAADAFKADLNIEHSRLSGMPLDAQASPVARKWLDLTDDLDGNFKSVESILNMHEALEAKRAVIRTKLDDGFKVSDADRKLLALPDDPRLLLRLAEDPALDGLFDNGIRATGDKISDTQLLLAAVEAGDIDALRNIARNKFDKSISELQEHRAGSNRSLEVKGEERLAKRERVLETKLSDLREKQRLLENLSEANVEKRIAAQRAKRDETVKKAEAKLRSKRADLVEGKDLALSRKVDVLTPKDEALARLEKLTPPEGTPTTPANMFIQDRDLLNHKARARRNVKTIIDERENAYLDNFEATSKIEDVRKSVKDHERRVNKLKKTVEEHSAYLDERAQLQSIIAGTKHQPLHDSATRKVAKVANQIQTIEQRLLELKKQQFSATNDLTDTRARTHEFEGTIDSRLETSRGILDEQVTRRKAKLDADVEAKKGKEALKLAEQVSLDPAEMLTLKNSLTKDLESLTSHRTNLLNIAKDSFDGENIKQHGAWIELDGEVVGAASAAQTVLAMRRAGQTPAQIFERMQVKGSDPAFMGIMDKAKGLGYLQSQFDDVLLAAGHISEAEAAARMGIRLNRLRDPAKAADYVAPLYSSNPQVALMETAKDVQHILYTKDMAALPGVLVDAETLKRAVPRKQAKIGGEQMESLKAENGDILVKLPAIKKGGSSRIPLGESPKARKGSTKYGELTGQWVSDDTAKLLQSVLGSEAGAGSRVSSIFKKVKVILNPVSHVNMRLGNSMTAAAAGVLPGSISRAGRVMDGNGSPAELLIAQDARMRGVWEGSSMQGIDHLYGQGLGSKADLAEKFTRVFSRDQQIATLAKNPKLDLTESSIRYFVDNVMGAGGALEASWVRHDRQFRLALYTEAVKRFGKEQLGFTSAQLKDPKVMAEVLQTPGVSNAALKLTVDKALDYASLPRGPRIPGTTKGIYEAAREFGPIPFLAYDLKATPLWTKLVIENAWKAEGSRRLSHATWESLEEQERLRRRALERPGESGWSVYPGGDLRLKFRFMSPATNLAHSLRQDVSEKGVFAFAPWMAVPMYEAAVGETADGRAVYNEGDTGLTKATRGAYHAITSLFLTPDLDKLIGNPANNWNGIWRKWDGVIDPATNKPYNMGVEISKLFAGVKGDSTLRANAIEEAAHRFYNQKLNIMDKKLGSGSISDEEHAEQMLLIQAQLWQELGGIQQGLETR